MDVCINFRLLPRIQTVEKSDMTELNKMKNRMSNTDAKQQMLKEPFKLLQEEFRDGGCWDAWREILQNTCSSVVRAFKCSISSLYFKLESSHK